MSIRSLRRRRRRSLVGKITVLGLGVGAAWALPPPPSGAYYTDFDEDCPISFGFRALGGNWDLHEPSFTAGGRNWGFVRHPEGGSWTDIPDGGPGVIDGYREELGGNLVGWADCFNFHVFLDDDVAFGDETEAAGIHEFGHLIGLRHTGDGDSLGSGAPVTNPPAMSTCRPFVSAGLTQDDHAQVEHMFDGTWGDEATINANVSFESPGTGWWTSAGLDMTNVTGDAAEGEHLLEIKGKSSAQSWNMHQTIRNTDLYDNYGAVIGYKDGVDGTSGNVGMRISTRQIDYLHQDPADCGYFSDFDLNRPDIVGPLTFRTPYGECATQNDWNYCSTGVTAWDAPSSWDAADIRLTVYKATNDTMWVDGVRIVGAEA